MSAAQQVPDYKAALQAQEQGNFEEAESAFRRALLAAPNEIPVLFRLACLLTNELDRHEEARQLFEKAIETDKDHLNSHFCLADLLACHLGRCDEAENHYREALRINPRNLPRDTDPYTDPYLTLWLDDSQESQHSLQLGCAPDGRIREA